jgi:hypothetical protein
VLIIEKNNRSIIEGARRITLFPIDYGTIKVFK